MNIKKIALNKYIEFSNYEGSQHIAKEHSIFRVLQLIKKEKPKNILEIGLGIGTIYSSVRSFSEEINYYGTETNEFCLNSLKKNLPKHFFSKLRILESVEDITSNIKFDIILRSRHDIYFKEKAKLFFNKNCV